MDTIVIWGGTLAILLNKLRRSLFKAEKIAFSTEEQSSVRSLAPMQYRQEKLSETLLPMLRMPIRQKR